MNLKISVLASMFLLSLTACYEDYNTPIEEEVIVEEPEIYVDAGITGKVTNSNGEGLLDYTLEINGIKYPQEDPYFLFTIEDLKKKGQLIKIIKDQIFSGLAFSYLIENDINPVEVYLFPEIETRLASEPANINFENITIDVAANSGASSIEVAHLGRDLPLQSGFMKSGERVLLQALGGVHIAFKDANATYLNLDNINTTITTSFAKTQSTALFFLNDRGQWQWEADANFEDISLSKSGLYLFAEYKAGIFAEGSIIKEDAPIAYQDLIWQDERLEHSIKTTVNGRFIDVVPSQADINIVVQNPCKNTITELEIATENEALQVPPVAIQSDDDHMKLVSKIVDCEGMLVEVPAIKITNGQNGDSFFLFGEDQINNWVPVCGSNFQIAAYDIESQSSGPSLPWVTQANDDLDYLSECSDFVDGYSYIEINGESKIFDPFKVVIENGQTFLSSQDDNVRFRVQGDTEQRFEVEDINVYINDETIGSGYFISCENSTLGCGLDDFVITHLDTQDGWVRASFSGEMWMQKLNPIRAGYYPVSGQILIKQD